MAHVLIKNISANVFGQIVNTITTFVLVPLYLATWGVQLYGVWLVLVAVPAMFAATADAGFIPVAGNEMAMQLARGKREDVASLFQSSWLFVSALSIVIMGITGVTITLFGGGRLLGITLVPDIETRHVLFVLLAVGLVNFQNGFATTALRAVGHMAEAIFTTQIFLLVESCAIAVALWLNAPFIVVALISFFARIVSLVTNQFLLRRYALWLHYGVSQARWDHIRNLFIPSVGFMFFPIGYAALFQGVLVVLGHILGPAAVAMFATTRTAANVMGQVINLFSWASWPEISRQFGLGRRDLVASYLTHGMQLAAIVSAGLSLVLIAGASTIFSVWTAGRIEADRPLIALLTLASAMATLRAYPNLILVATNRHVRYGVGFLTICLTVVVMAYLGGRAFGVYGAAAAVAVGESGILLLSTTLALSLIGEGAVPIKRILTTRPPLERLLISTNLRSADFQNGPLE